MKGTKIEVATYLDRRAKKRARVDTRNDDEIGASCGWKGKHYHGGKGTSIL